MADQSVFRSSKTIGLTAKALAAAAQGTSDTPPASAGPDVLSRGASICKAMGLTGGGTEKIEEMPSSYSNPTDNTVLCETEHGHSIQLDDTPSKESIRINHAHGSCIDFHPNGPVKYKTVSTRQDWSLAGHDIVVEGGDCRIVVDKGKFVINVKNNELEIHAESAVTINAKQKIELNADTIRLHGHKSIALNSPSVDLGGGCGGMPPMMSLPGGVTVKSLWPPDMTLVPAINLGLGAAGTKALGAALKVKDKRFDNVKKGAAAAGKETPSTDGLSLTNIVSRVISAIKVVAKLPGLLSQLATAATGFPSFPTKALVGLAIVKALKDHAKDATGQPAFSKMEKQPEQIPLSNPFLYKSNPEFIARRGRAFDTPEDVQNEESYNAHINLSVELKDYAQEERTSPGESIKSDTTLPAAEPHPATAFPLISGGTASVTANDIVVTGVNTMFTEDVEENETIIIGRAEGKVRSIVNNTVLILSEPWPGQTEKSAAVQSYRLRPIKEYFGVFKYGDTAPLGNTGLPLSAFFVNFQSPITEVPRVNVAALTETLIGGSDSLSDGASGGDGQECGEAAAIPNVFGTVSDVYNRGAFDLTTDEGGGIFTNQVVQALGPEWGHIRKNPGQTQAYGHAVDAIMYESSTPLSPNGNRYQVVDIIAAHGSAAAKPAWQPVCAPVDGSNWGGKTSSAPSTGGGDGQGGGGTVTSPETGPSGSPTGGGGGPTSSGETELI